MLIVSGTQTSFYVSQKRVSTWVDCWDSVASGFAWCGAQKLCPQVSCFSARKRGLRLLEVFTRAQKNVGLTILTASSIPVTWYMGSPCAHWPMTLYPTHVDLIHAWLAQLFHTCSFFFMNKRVYSGMMLSTQKIYFKGRGILVDQMASAERLIIEVSLQKKSVVCRWIIG